MSMVPDHPVQEFWSDFPDRLDPDQSHKRLEPKTENGYIKDGIAKG